MNFSLEMPVLVQIQLYFNRNVKQFTAMTTTVNVLLAAEGGKGLIEPVEPPSLRACLGEIYRSKDPTNSIKVLKEKRYKSKENPPKNKQHKIQQHNTDIKQESCAIAKMTARCAL